MLTLLARIIFILAAGVGLKALGRRTPQRQDPHPRPGGAGKRASVPARRGPDPEAAGRAGLPAAEQATPATFASFGGSAVSAAVAGKAAVDGVIPGHPGEAGGTKAATLAPSPALADPDPNGPTPRAEDRLGTEADALAEKHGSPAFAADFRSVDYGGETRPAWPHRDADGPDDGWTVPDPANDHRVAVPSDSPAAFKGSGGAAPLRGAPVAEEDSGVTRPDAAMPQPAVADGGGEGVDPPFGMPMAGAEAPAATGDAASAEGAPPAPAGLDAPRDGVPDDLTRISGVGPSIERLLFASGIFHIDQIAGWTEADVRWADRLTGFDGRAGREEWVEQARRLADGGSGS